MEPSMQPGQSDALEMPNSNAEEVLGALVQWLGQQHASTVGSDPAAVTDYSKALSEIRRLGGQT